MKKINLIFIFMFMLALAFISCESFELQGQDNPNQLNASKADPDLVLSNIQVSFASFFYSMSDDARRITRMNNMFGTYGAIVDPVQTDAQWRSAYSGILTDIKTVENSPVANIPYHKAIAKIIKAYVMVTLVDFYGDVPYSKSILGSADLNPAADSGSAIYDAMIVNIDEAIVLLGNTNVAPLTDLYYSGDSTKWIKLANSLKLKMYNNLRLTRDVSAQVNAIVASGKILSSNSDDFNYKYSSVNAPTDSRHPDFIANYFAPKDGYLSNSYYKLLLLDKPGIVDPRIRHYFYRQTTAAATGTNLPCLGNPLIPICSVGGGYWGRDHADNTGLPNDNTRRTIVGLYPFGGKFDNSTNVGNINLTAATDRGADGAGFLNILDYSYVQFMLAELSLTEPGVVGAPATLLTNAVTQNINKVRAFRTDKQIIYLPSNIATPAVVTSYIAAVNAKYTAAVTPSDKLNVIMKEYYIALWGNGCESYNMIRRTGMPLLNAANIGTQAPVSAAGDFPRSYPLPSISVSNNNNAQQHASTQQIFWDNNAAGFIN
jgi:hypothetical protein